MKISQDPVSAFAIYSEKLKQKKTKKHIAENGVNKPKKKTNSEKNDLNIHQMREIRNILKTLSINSPTRNGSLANSMKTSKKKRNLRDSEVRKIREISYILKTFPDPSSAVNDNMIGVSTSVPKECAPAIYSSTSRDSAGLKCIKNKKNRHPGLSINISTKRHIKDTDIVEINTKVANSPSFRMTNNDSSKNIGVKQRKGSTSTKIISNKLDKAKSKKKKNVLPALKTTLTQNVGIIPGTSTMKNNSNINQSLIAIKKRKKLLSKGSKVDFKKKRLEKNKIEWINQENSLLAGTKLFEWLIKPVSEVEFSQNYWEKLPLLIKREENRNYYSKLISTQAIDAMLRDNVVYFTKHIDVTSYTDGERQTHNVPGRAQANVVWDFYSNGCSIRLLNPQAFIPEIHTLLATLQDYFGCFVGSNVYLTPPASQGFAPHYDDIEAFVLQVEGKKQWKVYSPRSDSETLARYSSPNFSQDEIGEPILDMILEPGDMLYFPRGFIHQACTVEGEHSLHITLSAYQRTAWVDLLEKALPLALEKAAAEDVEFRKGLPRNYLGIEYHGNNEEKQGFLNNTVMLLSKLNPYLHVILGDAVDRMGARFMHDALPPVFTTEEKEISGLGGGLKMKENGKLVDRVEIELSTRVKLIRANVCRIVEEEGQIRLYHCLDNPLEYHAEEPQFLELPPEGIQVITYLFKKYPAFAEVKSIPHENDDVLLTLISDLWEIGLLVTRGLSTTKP